MTSRRTMNGDALARPVRGAQLAALVLGAAVSASIVGCASDEEAKPPVVEELRGGVVARAAIYDAIGILGHERADGKGARTGCTGTLIGPKKVLTAKHCVRDDAAGPDNRIEEGLTFFVGPSETDIRKRSKVVSARVPAPVEGGYIGYGSDVAVIELAEAITGVTFAVPATGHIPTSLIGKRMKMVGFGFDQKEVDGIRRVGPLTVVANQGTPLSRLFPTFGDFIKFVVKAENDPSIDDAGDDRNAMAARAYSYPLLSEQEVFVGFGNKDAQPCRNDSGAPLILEDKGRLVIWGVASGSLKLSDASCGNYGSYIATLGPSVQPILRD